MQRPGAGREAARLLDEQGVQRGDKTAPEQSHNEKKCTTPNGDIFESGQMLILISKS